MPPSHGRCRVTTADITKLLSTLKEAMAIDQDNFNVSTFWNLGGVDGTHARREYMVFLNGLQLCHVILLVKFMVKLTKIALSEIC